MADLLSEKYFKEQARWLDERDLRYFSVMKSYFLEFRKPAQDRSSLAGVLRREQEQGLNGVNYDTMKRLRKRMVNFFGEDDHFNLLDFNDEKPQVALTEEWIFQAFGASNLFFLSQSSSNYSFIFTYEQELQLVAKAKAEIEGPREGVKMKQQEFLSLVQPYLELRSKFDSRVHKLLSRKCGRRKKKVVVTVAKELTTTDDAQQSQPSITSLGTTWLHNLMQRCPGLAEVIDGWGEDEKLQPTSKQQQYFAAAEYFMKKKPTIYDQVENNCLEDDSSKNLIQKSQKTAAAFRDGVLDFLAMRFTKTNELEETEDTLDRKKSSVKSLMVPMEIKQQGLSAQEKQVLIKLFRKKKEAEMEEKQKATEAKKEAAAEKAAAKKNWIKAEVLFRAVGIIKQERKQIVAPTEGQVKKMHSQYKDCFRGTNFEHLTARAEMKNNNNYDDDGIWLQQFFHLCASNREVVEKIEEQHRRTQPTTPPSASPLVSSSFFDLMNPQQDESSSSSPTKNQQKNNNGGKRRKISRVSNIIGNVVNFGANLEQHIAWVGENEEMKKKKEIMAEKRRNTDLQRKILAVDLHQRLAVFSALKYCEAPPAVENLEEMKKMKVPTVNTMISFYKNNRHLLQDKHTLPEKKSGEQRAWANSLFEFVTSSRLDKEIEWVPLS